MRYFKNKSFIKHAKFLKSLPKHYKLKIYCIIFANFYSNNCLFKILLTLVLKKLLLYFGKQNPSKYAKETL